MKKSNCRNALMTLAFMAMSLILAGCSVATENKFRIFIPADTTVERQMEIVRLLESNGFHDVGIGSGWGAIEVRATRKGGSL